MKTFKRTVAFFNGYLTVLDENVSLKIADKRTKIVRQNLINIFIQTKE